MDSAFAWSTRTVVKSYAARVRRTARQTVLPSVMKMATWSQCQGQPFRHPSRSCQEPTSPLSLCMTSPKICPGFASKQAGKPALLQNILIFIVANAVMPMGSLFSASSFDKHFTCLMLLHCSDHAIGITNAVPVVSIGWRLQPFGWYILYDWHIHLKTVKLV